jgi:hypothetical protein
VPGEHHHPHRPDDRLGAFRDQQGNREHQLQVGLDRTTPRYWNGDVAGDRHNRVLSTAEQQVEAYLNTKWLVRTARAVRDPRCQRFIGSHRHSQGVCPRGGDARRYRLTDDDRRRPSSRHAQLRVQRDARAPP